MAPPLPVVPGALVIKLGWTLEADTNTHTRLFWRYSGSAPSSADCLTLATSIMGQASSHLAALLNAAYSLANVEVIDLSSYSGGVGTYTVGFGGSRSGFTGTASTALLVNYLINRRYRGGRPRGYWPLGSQSDWANNQGWGSSFLSAAGGGLGAFVTGIVGLSAGSTTLLDHVNISYYNGFTNVSYGTPTKYRRVPTPRTVPVIDSISSIVLSSKFGSVRRRIRAT